MNNYETNEKLKEIRKARKLSQARFAEDLGLNRRTYEGYESLRYKAPKHLLKLAELIYPI